MWGSSKKALEDLRNDIKDLRDFEKNVSNSLNTLNASLQNLERSLNSIQGYPLSSTLTHSSFDVRAQEVISIVQTLIDNHTTLQAAHDLLYHTTETHKNGIQRGLDASTIHLK